MKPVNSDQSSIEQLPSGTPNESSKVVNVEFLPENETTAEEHESDHFAHDVETDMKVHHIRSERTISDSGAMIELERVKREMKMMEAALQGAARQAQVFHLVHVIHGSFCMFLLARSRNIQDDLNTTSSLGRLFLGLFGTFCLG
ncbi:golgin candidate 5-like [Vigna umbellata]|uniref:golgin candidate 5-like n=1 Tax=Vigna umbellata TaxID=87088 RepID=UPI001F5F8E7E|nr:golgin candidate 5-like [Vigna umbellata]